MSVIVPSSTHAVQVALSRRATIKDVAKVAGVVPSTVSQALNGKGYVEAATRQRILDAVRDLGYHPSARGRRLRSGGVQTIALVSAMPFGVAAGASRLGFLMEIASVAAMAALSRGLALVLVPTMPVGDRSVMCLEHLDIDGAMVVEPAAEEPQLNWLLGRGLPVVCLGRQPEHEEVPYVDLHSALTADVLLEHLWDQGARHVALLVGAKQRTSYLETETRYQAFCEKRGMEPLVRRVDEDGGEGAGQAATAELLALHPELDGLCALVDAFATGAVQAAKGRQLRIPQDIRIVTRYDGLRAKTSQPPLTAVNLHLEEVASLGVELLLNHLQGARGVMFLQPPEPVLVVRQSSRAE